MSATQASPGIGFNVVGYVSANTGVAVSARHFIRLLLDTGHPVSILDMSPGLGRGKRDETFAEHMVDTPDQLRYDINLVFLFVPDYVGFLLTAPAALLDGRTNVCIVWWELTVMPAHWIEALQMFDIVVAASGFVRHVLEANLSGVPIVYAPQPLYLLADREPDRARFGLASGRIVFLSSFEPHSDPERKNPFAVIDAFRAAFPHAESVSLVVKLNNAEVAGTIDPDDVAATITRRAGNDPRVQVLRETLSYADTIRLYASCDVFVSLHRAEGLGLGPMEAMTLGKPVIATAWSGNLTFMDQSSSCLVGYRLVPVQGRHPFYTRRFLGKDCSWADPDVDEAAWWMRALAADPDLRRSIGAAAARTTAALQRVAAQAHFVDEIASIRQRLLARASPTRIGTSQRQQLRRVEMRQSATPWQRLAHEISELVGRHVLWRFRRRA